MRKTCQTPIHPITPTSLLDSICWSISEPTSTVSIYTDSFSVDGTSEHPSTVFLDAKGDGKDSEASFMNLTQPLTESEESELMFKYHFLTILLPIDRFAEMGPSERFSAIMALNVCKCKIISMHFIRITCLFMK